MVSPLDLNSERQMNQTFMCSALGGPGNTFTWTRLLDGMEVSQMSDLTVVVDGADKGGYYQCTVQNDAGNETDDIILRGIAIPANHVYVSIVLYISLQLQLQ